MAIRVLLIDDDSTSREGIAGYLQDVAGFDVTDHASGDEALAHLDAAWRDYTVVLLDFVLGPPMSGNQVLQEILARYPRLPVIVFTGLDPTGGIQTLGQGAYAYMRRPLDYTQMIYIIQDLAEQGMILSQMARDVKEFLGSDVCLVWRLDRREQHFRVTAWAGDLDEEYRQNVTLDAGDKIWPKFFGRGKPVYLPDVTDPCVATRYRHQEAAKKRGWTSLVSIPLVHEERIIGLLDSYTYKPLEFADRDERRRMMGMLRAFARQAAEAVRFADLSRRAKALQEISQTLADTMEEKTLLRQILYKALELVGTNMGWLYIVDANTGKLILKDSLGTPRKLLDSEREPGEGITGWVVGRGMAFNVPDVSQVPCHKPMPGLEVNSEIAVPLRRGEQTIGVLTAQSRFLNNFTNDDVDLLTSLAAQAAVVIERAKLARHLQEVSHLALVGEFSEIARYVVEAVRDLTGAEVNLWMMSDREEEGDNFLRIVASKGDISEDFVQNTRLPTEPGGSINAQALEERRPIVIDDIFSEHEGVRFFYIEEARQHGWHSFMAVPLFGRDDECLGTLSLYGKVVAKFGKSEMELVQTFANQAATAFQQQNRIIALQQLAQVGQTLTESMTDQPKHLLQQVAGIAHTLTRADCTVIYPYDLVKKRFFAKEGIASVGMRQPLSVVADKPRPKGVAALIQRVGAIVVHDIDKGEVQVGLGAVEDPDVDDGDIIQIIRSAKFVQRESIKAFVGISLRVAEKGNGKQSKSQEVGILYVDFRAPHHFTQEELQIIKIYAHLVANVIRGSRLYTEAQKQATELTAVHETALNIVAAEDVSTRLEVIVKAATELLKGKGGKVYLCVPDQDELELVAVKGIDSAILKPGDRIPFGEGMAGKVIRSKEWLIVDDYSTWPGRVEQFAPLFTAVIEVPLLIGEEAIGVLAVFHDKRERTFTEDNVPVLQRLAQQAALAIHNASILAKSQTRLELLDALHEIALDIVGHLDLGELMEAIIERAANLMAGEHHKGIGAAYWRCDHKIQKAVIEHSRNSAFLGNRN
jgi:GAF domain-containing protein